MTWVKFPRGSWHLWDMRAVVSGRRPYKTLCGKRPPAGAPEADELPMHEKSCESCLRAKETR